MTIYIFDFDGVICDSRKECLYTSYYSYQNSIGNISFPEDNNLQINSDISEYYYTYRHLVRVAREFFYLWKAYQSKSTLNLDQSLSNQIEASPELLETYRLQFFKFRKSWKAKNFHQWLSLNEIYTYIKDILTHLDLDKTYIVSAKDKSSIQDILDFHSIPFNSEHILGSDQKKGKSQHFSYLKKLYPNENIIFLDDNLSNLITAKSFSFQPFLAKWGYCSSEDISKAIQHQFTCFSLNSAYQYYSQKT